MPKRFALLVGIDVYPNNGSRKDDVGRELKPDQLRGGTNDVRAIEEFLNDKYKFDDICTLTSSSPYYGRDDATPVEPPQQLPTFANISAKFDSISERAVARDLFYFHYSGHGAQLPRRSGSPNKDPRDPALITVDYYCGQPAVFGWQLNQWLKKLDAKGIQVVVTIDSCHSGGCWRSSSVNHSFRTPSDWPPASSLPVDDEAVADSNGALESASRDAKLRSSWSINPEFFTLMAACGDEEKAAEVVVNGKSHGAFTWELLSCLQQTGDGISVNYRMITDQLKIRLQDQTPETFGRDRLLFFGSVEAMLPAPLVAHVEGAFVVIPAGRAHGVNVGSEFTLLSGASHVTFSVGMVEEFESSAMAPRELSLMPKAKPCIVISSRWSMGEDERVKIYVDTAFDAAFRGWLHEQLEQIIASPVEVIQSSGGQTETDDLRLERWGEADARIWGPKCLTGVDAPVQPLRLGDVDSKKLARRAAFALGHLVRFRQILLTSPPQTMEVQPFEVRLEPVKGGAGATGIYPINQQFKYKFFNKSDKPLYLAVLILTPEFSIEQLFPRQDYPFTTRPDGMKSFSLTMGLPKGPDWIQEAIHRTSRRDIVRTLVTRGRSISWKSLELSNIWDAGPTDFGKHVSSMRGGLSGVDWWLHDEHIVTGSG